MNSNADFDPLEEKSEDNLFQYSSIANAIQ